MIDAKYNEMNEKIRCLVVDDERLARVLLQNFIAKLPQLELVAQCKNALEASACLQKEKIDLLFLDIQMPGLTGVELLQSLQHQPLVVFTTAYSEYALESYQYGVIDYLLKPFAFNRFLKAVNKASEQITLLRKVEHFSTLTFPAEQPVIATEPTDKKDFILIKAAHKIYKIKYEDILYIQSMKEYVAIHTKTERILALHSLKKLETELPDDLFIRIHKSYTVSINKVTSLEGNLICIHDQKIPIGSMYKDNVMEKIF